MARCRDLATIAVGLEKTQEAQARGQAVDLIGFGQACGTRRRLEAELFGDSEPEEDQKPVALLGAPDIDLGLPALDLSRLTELELFWFSYATERAVGLAESGYEPWWSRGALLIYAALRRVSMGLGRPCDFEVAQCIHHYVWVQHRATLRPYSVEYFAAYHVESEAVSFDHESYPADSCEPEADEHYGWIEPAPAELPAPARGLPAPSGAATTSGETCEPGPDDVDEPLAGEYQPPPRHRRHPVHPEVLSAFRRVWLSED